MSASVKSQPPKKRTLIIVPDVPNVSRRCIASKIDSRVFSPAHTPARPPELNSCTCLIWPAGCPSMPFSLCEASFSNANLPV
jgi:hypothetical protein